MLRDTSKWLQFLFRPMRKPGKWMKPVDERILEVLRSEGNLQPKTIADIIDDQALDLDYHTETIGRRCRELNRYGLLNRFGAGVYSITELGELYLSGELDAGDLEAAE